MERKSGNLYELCIWTYLFIIIFEKRPVVVLVCIYSNLLNHKLFATCICNLGIIYSIPPLNLLSLFPVWSSWEPWTDCPVTCGQGVSFRDRECLSGDCIGFHTERKPCQIHASTDPPCIGEI